MLNKKNTIALMGLLSLVTLSTKSQAAESEKYESNGMVEFIPSLDPTDPLDPTNPDPEKPVKPIDPTDPTGPKPGTNGPLSIDYASSLDFGKNRISNKDQTYFARAQKLDSGRVIPNYVQISDNRGTNSGWTLKIKQLNQFKAVKKTLNETLTGAEISFSIPQVKSNTLNVIEPLALADIALVPGEESVVTSAKDGSGAGTWSTYWGAVENVDERNEAGEINKVDVTKAIKLTIPGSTPKDAVNYLTKLEWSLTDVPGN